MHQPTGEATFHGHARLWQQANSIAAPMIELDRTRQTLVAHTTMAADPVRIVLLSASTLAAMTGESPAAEPRGATAKTATPSVIRIHGGDLKYSAAERKAFVQGGIVGTVTTETATATATSSEVEAALLPPGIMPGRMAPPHRWTGWLRPATSFLIPRDAAVPESSSSTPAERANML